MIRILLGLLESGGGLQSLPMRPRVEQRISSSTSHSCDYRRTHSPVFLTK